MLNKHHMTKSGFASIKSMVLANRLALEEAKLAYSIFYFLTNI
jgi:hypothetical protein